MATSSWAVSIAPLIPANDVCATPTDFGSLPAEGSCPGGSATETVGWSAIPLSPVSEGPSCLYNYYPLNDVFYTFEAPSTGSAKFSISNLVNASYPQLGVALYDVCSGTEISCQGVSTSSPVFLNGLTSGNDYIVQFYLSQNTSGTEPTNFSVDVCMEAVCPPPSNLTISNKLEALCAAPASLTTNNTTTTTTDASWSGSTSGTWEIEWGVKGFSLGSGTQITNITATSHTLTGLTSGSRLSYYVRNNCGNGDYSTWSGSYHFNTDLACGQNLTDSGGSLNDYGDYENKVWTIYPTVSGDKAIIDFTQFTLSNYFSSCPDGMTFHNGQQLRRIEIEGQQETMGLDLSDLEPGVYILKWLNGKDLFVEKIVIQ